MSRNFAVLSKSASAMSPAAPREWASQPAAPSAEYVELIRRVFHGCSVVAVVGSGFDGVAGVCDDIAAELAASGKRVVVVPVDRLLNMSPAAVTSETVLVPGSSPNVWHWPSSLNRQIEFFKSQSAVRMDPDKWLDFLRQNFDSVLFSCPPLELPAADGVTEIAAMADVAVLVVEADRTPKQRIQRDQRALQSRGVKLAGCILVKRK
jgi:Mrp family chromosome partitioning ATPase